MSVIFKIGKKHVRSHQEEKDINRVTGGRRRYNLIHSASLINGQGACGEVPIP